jgi:hypothetical protein
MRTPRNQVNTTQAFLKAALIGAAIWVNVASTAVAQDWIPPKCCPETDCSANSLKVTEEKGGFRVEGVTELVTYDDPRLQLSMDGKTHACVRSQARPWMSEAKAAIMNARREVKCLFVPFTG